MKFGELILAREAMYREAAAGLVGKLACSQCRVEVACSAEQAQHYLQVGWPTCCDKTMRLAQPIEVAVSGGDL